MSCCGCASRVLKLQSEIRSWKSKLGDEKREKKMILRWIMAVFGFDIRVDIDKETHCIRVEATENKEGMEKALVKVAFGRGDEVGMMVMEQKLESHEFFEPFEDPYEATEFPILEINSMPTQQSIVNTGIHYGHLSQNHSGPQTMSITTPIETTTTALSTGSSEQEVLYLAGNFEEGATIEGSNGQSYILVRAGEGDEMPMQLDYSSIIKEEVVDDGNLYYRLATAAPNGIETAINYLPVTQTSSLSTVVSHAPAHSLVRESEQMETDINVMTEASESSGESVVRSYVRKKPNASPKVTGQGGGGGKSVKKQKSSSSEMNIKIKNVHSKSVSTTKASSSSISKHFYLPEATAESSKSKSKQSEALNSINKKGVFEFGLTLREKAEIYVIGKAKDAVEKVSNGFRCTVCEENRYIYSNYDTAVAHTKTHYESKPYKCEHCDELFSIQKELLKHRKTIHAKPKGAVTSISSRLTPQARASRKSTEGEVLNVKSVSTTADESTSPNSQTRTIIVQAPFGKNLMSGPISISSDVLAALLGSSSNSSSITVACTSATQQPKSVAIPVVTKAPKIAMTAGSTLNPNTVSIHPERRAIDSGSGTKIQSFNISAFPSAQKDKSTMK
ncbi:unnamed protein product [Orchesella dallaii]|uniref:C2H2-type domain-containing protein n=1 Tax=Orchesella dallaii TaxID=48710 RepID=A0ABP1QCD8_9HEXA